MAETPILAGLEWVETQEQCLDTEVGEAIGAYCTEAGIEAPDCESLGWFVPVGTEMLDQSMLDFMHDRRKPAQALKVQWPGVAFVLLLDWDGMCGCEDCGRKPSMHVVEVIR